MALPAIIAVLAPVIGAALEKLIPNTAERERVAGEIAQQSAVGAQEALIGQLEINKIEAANPSLFVSGYRPAVGWVCVAALAYQYLGWALLSWVAALASVPAPPQLDTTDLMFLLGSLLGVAVPRTIEKLKGVARSK